MSGFRYLAENNPSPTWFPSRWGRIFRVGDTSLSRRRRQVDHGVQRAAAALLIFFCARLAEQCQPVAESDDALAHRREIVDLPLPILAVQVPERRGNTLRRAVRLLQAANQ